MHLNIIFSIILFNEWDFAVFFSTELATIIVEFFQLINKLLASRNALCRYSGFIKLSLHLFQSFQTSFDIIFDN